MPGVRFRLRTIMSFIAAAAVLMGLLRWSPTIGAFVAMVVFETGLLWLVTGFSERDRGNFG
jgi:hypothetical protein